MRTSPHFPNWNIDVPDYQLLFMAAFPFTTKHVERLAYESSENCLETAGQYEARSGKLHDIVIAYRFDSRY